MYRNRSKLLPNTLKKHIRRDRGVFTSSWVDEN